MRSKVGLDHLTLSPNGAFGGVTGGPFSAFILTENPLTNEK